jgi:hypothetical protein
MTRGALAWEVAMRRLLEVCAAVHTPKRERRDAPDLDERETYRQ